MSFLFVSRILRDRDLDELRALATSHSLNGLLCILYCVLTLFSLHYAQLAAGNSHGCLALAKALDLESKGLEIVDAMGKTRTEEFIAMNPCHCCPTLEFGGEKGAIWESCACMRTMCQIFEGGEKYYPIDPILRGKIDLVCDWKNTVCVSRSSCCFVIL